MKPSEEKVCVPIYMAWGVSPCVCWQMLTDHIQIRKPTSDFYVEKKERTWAASKALNPALPAQSTAGSNAGWVAPISEAVAQPTWGFSPSSSQLWVRWPKTRTWTSDVWSIFLAEAYTWWSKKQSRDESDTKNCNLSTLLHKCAKERGHTKERKIQYMHSDLQ